jgi:hypothetical protein
MEHLNQIFIFWVGICVDHAATFLSLLTNENGFSPNGKEIIIAMTLGVTTVSNIPEAILASIRRWRGNTGDKFNAISNIYSLFNENKAAWNVPDELFNTLKNSYLTLLKLISKCKTTDASTNDRTRRSSLLKTTVGFCLLDVKSWVLSQYIDKVLTVDDVHALGFFAPGEIGGHRSRKEPTDVLAEIKIRIVNADFIHVVVDQAAKQNAATARHGWPHGVKMAVIVILAIDGVTAVIRLSTTQLHNNINMPEGSHGHQFIAKAAFLRHPNDEPRFGPEPTFSMPLTTGDMVTSITHRQNLDTQRQEIERQRIEIERLREELRVKK